jgi:hypothetical protein
MTRWTLVAVMLMASAVTARADDPPPAPPPAAAAPASSAPPKISVSTVDDDPGAPGENDPAPPPGDPTPTPAPAPAPAPAPVPSHNKARMSMPPARAVHHERLKDEEGRLEKSEDEVAGGKHWRIKTSQGAVHVWVPEGYDRATAGTVVYVHGYWTDADGAWKEHQLAKQFRASHQNAMFIVPDAPASNDDAVNWPALTDLRHAVARANLHLPDGPVIVMGHSGAFRTIMQWVDHRLVDQIILLDALYAGESAFDEYIGTGKHADEHKLIVVAASTAEESASFAKKYKFAVARERMPDSAAGFTRHERTAKLLYIRSQYEHMQIVTGGKVIPTLLHLTPLKAL